MKTAIIIPARYGSSRLEGKPLIEVNGKPIIQWVYEKAQQSKSADMIIVATDDERISKAVKSFGGNVEMTSAQTAKSDFNGDTVVDGFDAAELDRLMKATV